MKLREMNAEVGPLRRNNQLNERSEPMRDMLSVLFGVIERFESAGADVTKSSRDKIELLRSIITDMLSDEERRSVVRGD